MDNYVIVFDNIAKFAEHLEKYKSVHVFFDDTVDKMLVNYVCSSFDNKNVTKSFFPACVASVWLAEKIKCNEEDVVVAIGGTNLQNLAKYFAFLCEIGFVSVPVHECSEYLLSKYAFVKDQYFCFYECEKPKLMFVMNQAFDQNDKLNMQNILLFKNVVYFEKEFQKDIFACDNYVPEKIVKCVNICDFDLKAMIKLLAICAGEIDEFLPYSVVGSEYYFLSMLSPVNMTTETIKAQNVLTKLYDCYLKYPLLEKPVDVNLHISRFKNFDIDILDLTETVLPVFDDKNKKEIDYRLNAYLPYLKNVFDQATNKFVPKKVDGLDKKDEYALALCSGLFSRKTMLRFMRDYGYFENLLID